MKLNAQQTKLRNSYLEAERDHAAAAVLVEKPEARIQGRTRGKPDSGDLQDLKQKRQVLLARMDDGDDCSQALKDVASKIQAGQSTAAMNGDVLAGLEIQLAGGRKKPLRPAKRRWLSGDTHFSKKSKTSPQRRTWPTQHDLSSRTGVCVGLIG